MKRIIVLKGVKDTGKTKTMYKLYDMLLAQGEIVEEKQEIKESPKDFKCIIEYKCVKVALFSNGRLSETKL